MHRVCNAQTPAMEEGARKEQNRDRRGRGRGPV